MVTPENIKNVQTMIITMKINVLTMDNGLSREYQQMSDNNYYNKNKCPDNGCPGGYQTIWTNTVDVRTRQFFAQEYIHQSG